MPPCNLFHRICHHQMVCHNLLLRWGENFLGKMQLASLENFQNDFSKFKHFDEAAGALCTHGAGTLRLEAWYFHRQQQHFFKKMGQPQPQPQFIFSRFQTNIITILKICENVHPVYGARIRTHDLRSLSLLPKPLDQGPTVTFNFDLPSGFICAFHLATLGLNTH